MEFFDIANAAGSRWAARAKIRQQTIDKIRSGKGLEVESADRIQKRLDRLAENTKKANAAVERVLAQPNAPKLVQTIGLERVIGRSDFLDINFMELALAVARFVGRINIRSAQGRTLGYGTGFMVSPRLLLTNNHVLTSAEDAQHSLVEFDFQNDRTGRPLTVVGFRLEPSTFFMTSEPLDFSLVAVSEVSSGGLPLQRYGWSRLIADQGKALLGESLNIIQHPRGEAKQIVLRSNELVDLFDHFAHYVTDTDPGSSGSPVYNDQWEVVALHHSGVVKKDEQGNPLAKDGSIWQDGMDPDTLEWVANEGIRISSIVDHISRQPLSGLQAQLRQDLLNLEPPSPLEAAAASSQGTGDTGSAGGGWTGNGTPAVSSAGATWTIPLTVTVQLGGQAPAVAVAPPTPAPAAPPVAIVAAQTPSLSSTSRAADAELREALGELEKAGTRPYYDADADRADRDAYYAGLPREGSGTDSFNALHELLVNTHKNRLNYKPAVHLYPWVDLHPPGDGEDIVSIYSGKRFSARELIEKDFEIDQQREQLRETLRRPALSGQEAVIAAEAFEAVFPYNCEHVVPQSWFNKRDPMRGDLHHLFACEMNCNSFRGNTPYFDFVDYQGSAGEAALKEVIKSACGKSENTRFEPFAGKGAVARATLYFLLRYPGEINGTRNEYTADRIDTLVAWHKSNEVTDYERHRNAAIFEKQGNRNPLIDFPEWADHIDFARGLGR